MSDNKVVALFDEKRAKATGERSFVVCPCGSQDGFLPVVMHDANPNPLLLSLLCPACETEFIINGARLLPPEMINRGDEDGHDD